MLSEQEKAKVQPLILIILDGWGEGPAGPGNAVELARTPHLDKYRKQYPFTTLCAHGERVGLPKNQPGNSEAGHLNLGAGRCVVDDAVEITNAIKDGTFYKNPIFLEALRYFHEHRSKVHLFGLITEENSAHSSPGHWLAMIDFLTRHEVKEIYLHLFTDGRDSGQHAAVKIIDRFQDTVNHNHNHNGSTVSIASVVGRFYAMDRRKVWKRIEQVYDLLTLGRGLKASSAKEAIVAGYNRQETDEFISPTVITEEDGSPLATIDDQDVVFFMNLRSDRARELTKAFTQENFLKKNPGAFKKKKEIKDLFFVALTDFGPDLGARTAYPSRLIKDSLPVVLDGLKQLYIAEEEKFAHVTFFFNGGYDHAVMGEERVKIPSPQVKSYDQTPKMNAEQLTKVLLQKIKDEQPRFILVNFCNTDMLGHTGNIAAAKQTAECVDQCLGKIVNLALSKNYVIAVTADHGNAERMLNPETKETETTHTTNPVPFILIGKKIDCQLKKGGDLTDVAPTVLQLMGLTKPKTMTGHSLIVKKKH